MEDRSSEQIAIDEGVQFGVSYSDSSSRPEVGPDSVIRHGTVIYNDVVAGRSFVTGHHAIVREATSLGDNVLVGTQAVIDGETTVGNNVSMQTGVYVPRQTTIANDIFIGPNATLLNDPYPVRTEVDLAGPTLKTGVSIGAAATVLPDVTVDEDAFVAAGAVVTDDVPPETLAIGVPATHYDLPAELRGENNI